MTKRAGRQTLDEARKAFPNSWVVFGEPKVGNDDELIDGIVFFHSEDRDQAIVKLGEYPGDASLEFTGAQKYRDICLTSDGINKQAA